MRKVDITEKLNFEDDPKLIIRGEEYQVNSDALTMLKVMQCMNDDNPKIDEIMSAYEAMFPERERKRLEKLKLKFTDFTMVIQQAVALVTGEGTETGE